MVVDKFENALKYHHLGRRIETALKFLEVTDFSGFPEGRHNIEEDEIYLLLNEYHTKDKSEAHPEAHRKYIDIQCVLEGCEYLGFEPFNNQKIFKDYDSEKDFILYDTEPSFIKFEKGMFAIFFPDDLHMPGIKCEDTGKIRKIVVKVLI